jgi:uncharacterized membrane protein
MIAYFALKFVHILGAAVLFGTGVGIAYFMLQAHLTGDARVIAGVSRIVVVADFLFTATAVVLQPITGFMLARVAGFPLFSGWVAVSLALYVAIGCLWLPVVWMQMKLHTLSAAAAETGAPLPNAYHRLFRMWFAFGIPAFLMILVIFWLMIAKPLL